MVGPSLLLLAAMATSEQVAMIAQAIALALNDAGFGRVENEQEKGNAYRKKLEEKHFRRVEKWDGTEEKWNEWSEDMLTSANALNTTVSDAMEVAARHAGLATGAVLDMMEDWGEI